MELFWLLGCAVMVSDDERPGQLRTPSLPYRLFGPEASFFSVEGDSFGLNTKKKNSTPSDLRGRIFTEDESPPRGSLETIWGCREGEPQRTVPCRKERTKFEGRALKRLPFCHPSAMLYSVNERRAKGPSTEEGRLLRIYIFTRPKTKKRWHDCIAIKNGGRQTPTSQSYV